MAGQLPSVKNKAELRAAALKKRDDLTTRVAEKRSRALCEHLGALDELEQFRAIAAYAPIRNEIDASDYLTDRQAEGAQLYFPRVRGHNALDFVAVDSLEELSPGAFDVPEPDGEPASLTDIELFFVPGAAFDRQGRRLGFGRGFYDRALARAIRRRVGQSAEQDGVEGDPPKAAPIFVGICYEWQLIEGQIPVEPHDISMDIIATDAEVVFCSDRRLI
jgi:5-formyltetrahydrofolate cyclo-ligase